MVAVNVEKPPVVLKPLWVVLSLVRGFSCYDFSESEESHSWYVCEKSWVQGLPGALVVLSAKAFLRSQLQFDGISNDLWWLSTFLECFSALCFSRVTTTQLFLCEVVYCCLWPWQEPNQHGSRGHEKASGTKLIFSDTSRTHCLGSWNRSPLSTKSVHTVEQFRSLINISL